MAEGRVESQRLLVPEPVDLTAAEAAALIEQSELLAQLGLEVEPFGGDTVLVRSMPAMLPRVVPERLVRDLADHFRISLCPQHETGWSPSSCTWSPARRPLRRASPFPLPKSTRSSTDGTWWLTRITAHMAGPPRWFSPRPILKSSSAGSK